MAKRVIMNAAQDFVTFLNKAVTPFHAVRESVSLLRAAGFVELNECDQWDVKPLGKYYITRNSSSIVAFAVGGKYVSGNGFTAVAAHTDSPCLKVKPRSLLNAHDCVQVGVCGYGGALFRTWFDRDLTVAGRLFVQTGGPNNRIEQRLVHITKPLLYIPNLCIHLDTNRDSFTFNKEDHLRTIIATETVQKQKEVEETCARYTEEMLSDHHKPLLQCLADAGNVRETEKIMDFELYLLDTQPAAIGGVHDEFIAGARLDNLVGTYTTIKGLVDAQGLNEDTNIRLAACYDNEECGSQSAQGAGSALTEWVMRRLAVSQTNNVAFEQAIAKSMVISADQAHAVHPNYAAKHEEKHRPTLHAGVVVKVNANQRYATTPVTHNILRLVAERADVPLQKVVVRNDSLCGSTIGPILSSGIGVRTVDVGTAQWAMHSIRELMGTQSIDQSIRLFKAFYETYPEVFNSMDIELQNK